MINKNDILVCLNSENGAEPYLTKNKTYNVLKTREDCKFVSVIDDLGNENEFLFSRFSVHHQTLNELLTQSVIGDVNSIIEYKIISSNKIKEFEDQINELISCGWNFQGNLILNNEFYVREFFRKT